MKKVIITLMMVLFAITVQAQFTEQIDSIQFQGVTNDSLVFVVYSTIDGGANDVSIEYVEEEDIIKINILYTQFDQADCYCPVQDTIKIKEDAYTKGIVEVKACFEQYYWTVGIQEIDLSKTNIIDNLLGSHKITNYELFLYPNPTSSEMTVTLNNPAVKIIAMELYDLFGKKVQQQAVNQSYSTLKMNELEQGIYILKVWLNQGDMVVRKVMRN